MPDDPADAEQPFDELPTQFNENTDAPEVTAPTPATSGRSGTGSLAPGATHALGTIGDYAVVDKLGQGGMGAVYRARQVSLGRMVALKILPAQFEEDEDFVTRFQREARLAASLNHPNLVRVYSSGQADGSHFIAMELVEGETLSRRVKRGALPMDEATRICLDVARALQCGWQSAQLIHRDIKPSNIYLSQSGEVKLGDLGLAKSLLGNTTGLTHTGAAMGTPHYISPEQARGDKAVDFRTDIYSLGCTLYQCLTGRTPYEGDPLTVMNLHLSGPPAALLKALPGCPIPVARLVGKMMKKQRHERHQSYEELIEQMESVLSFLEAGGVDAGAEARLAMWREVGDGARTPAPSKPKAATELAAPKAKSKVPLFPALAGAAILVLGAIGFLLTRPAKSRNTATVAKPVKPAIAPAAAPTPSTPDAGSRSLFDGRTFAGWKRLGSDDWTIADGALIAGRSNLISEEQFGDFELTLEWRVSEGGNGGVSYHAPPTGNGGVPEMQLCGPKGDPKWATGTLYRVVRTTDDATPTPGQWNRARLVVRGGKAEHWINDRLVCSYDFDDPSWLAVAANSGYPIANQYAALHRRGALILQGYLPEIAYRNIRIRSLDRSPTAAATPKPASASGSPVASAPTSADSAVSLLPLVQLPRDVSGGTWSVKPEGLSLDAAQGFARCEFPYEPPEEYDFEVEFTPKSGGNNVDLHLRAGGASVMWKLNAYSRTPPMSAFATLDGRNPNPEVSKEGPALEIGRRYTTRVEVRRTGLRGFLDGREILSWSGDFKRFTKEDSARLHDERHLGLGSYSRSVLFHRAKVRVVNKLAGLPTPPVSPSPATALTFAGHRYQLMPGDTTWTEAKDAAVAMGGHLVAINNAEENDWIRRTFVDPLEEGKMFWIGATNAGPDGQWRWVNGDAFTFTGWAADIIAERRFTNRNSCSGFCRNLVQGIGWSLWAPSVTTGRNIGFLVEWDVTGSAESPTTPGAPGQNALPAAATKDTPFINTLGMKFVPVPITGGPTGGKRVLFSVWDTRVQDYEVFVQETRREWPRDKGWPAGLPAQGPDHPAVNMTWADAQAFCVWLSERERKAGKLAVTERFRLPSDHEWSCAIGIGEREDAAKTPAEKNGKIEGFPWGTTWPPPVRSGNYLSEELRPHLTGPGSVYHKGDPAGYRDGYAMTSPVGTFPANALGLADMGGNVWQWCEDWFDASQKDRVVRGAGWNYTERGFLLSSARHHDVPNVSFYNNGYRVVLAPAP